MAKVLLAKTALDGHWRGLTTVARALRDAGHEVVLLGMARDDEIAAVAVDEDVDLVGLNVGGRIEVVERILDALAGAAPDVPVFAGGTIAPWAARRLAARHVEVFPPGSSLADIGAAATRLTSRDSGPGIAPAPADGDAATSRPTTRDSAPDTATPSADLAVAAGPASGDAGSGTAPVSADRSADRASELLDVAARLFDEQGFAAVGMRALAEAAGASTGILYHHFGGKNDILYRICLSMTQEFVDAHLPVLDGPGPASERLATLVRDHIVFFWGRRHWLSVAFRDLRCLEPGQFAVVTGHRRRYQDAIRDVVAEGAAAGDLDVDDPTLATLALLDMINGINGWFTPDGRFDITDLADRYARMVVGGLLGADRARRAEPAETPTSTPTSTTTSTTTSTG